MGNSVFVACSLDGFIADKDGSVSWLEEYSGSGEPDHGYSEFITTKDALVMGRKTFETVVSFDVWPYDIPVFVLTKTLKALPAQVKGKAEIVLGQVSDIVLVLNSRGFKELYIDGGETVQQFLRQGAIDRITITTIPIVLGGGARLFGENDEPTKLEHVETHVFDDGLVQTTYRTLSPQKTRKI